MTRKLLVAILISSFLAGCGGGASHTLSLLPGSSPSSTPAGPGSAGAAKARATIRLTIPRGSGAAVRRRAFVSPSTQGVSVEVTHKTNGTVDYDATVNYNTAPGSTSVCTGSDPQICTLQIPAPIAPSPDADSFSFTLYDRPPAGTPLAFGSFAHVLGTGTLVASIAPNVNNAISAYIGGIPASAGFAPAVISGDGYLGFGSTFGAEAFDEQQNAILGGVYDPYNPGFSIGVTDQQLPAGSTTLSIAVSDLSSYAPAPPVCNAAATAVTSVTTCRSSDILSFAYLQPSASAFDTAYYATVAASTLVGPALYVSPIYVNDTRDTATATSGGPSFTQGSSGTSPAIALDGAIGTVVLSEPGPTIDGLPLSFTAAENGQCGGVIASGGVSALSATSFTIAGATGTAPAARRRSVPSDRRRQNTRRRALQSAACVVTFTDNFGGSVALDVTDLGEASQFIAIPGETLYAGQNTNNNGGFIAYDLIDVQPASPYSGDPYFAFDGDTFGAGAEGTQVAHSAPDQSGNYTLVIADDVAGRLFTFPVTAPTSGTPAYTVGSNVAEWPLNSAPAASVTGGVAVDSHGNAYASLGATLGMFSLPSLTQIATLDLTSAPGGSTPHATGIALDSSGRVFVADSANALVNVFTNDFQGGLTLENQIATGAGSDPQGVAVDSFGNLFVVLANDGNGASGQSQVVVFTPGATAPSASANVTPAGFGVAADAKGQVFVETAGSSPGGGGAPGGGLYRYTFAAATASTPATLTGAGPLTYQGTPVNATGGYLNF